jgi:hypothetical protein
MMANQYGDFIGRYIKYEHDTKVKGRDVQDTINEAMDDFVFYDEPTSVWMQAANDYGFMMFMKFFLRIQRVNARLLGQKPATMLGTTALAGAIAPGQFIDAYFGAAGKMVNRFNVVPPFEAAAGIPIMDWAALPLEILGLND